MSGVRVSSGNQCTPEEEIAFSDDREAPQDFLDKELEMILRGDA